MTGKSSVILILTENFKCFCFVFVLIVKYSRKLKGLDGILYLELLVLMRLTLVAWLDWEWRDTNVSLLIPLYVWSLLVFE